jgi:hypothetical protein
MVSFWESSGLPVILVSQTTELKEQDFRSVCDANELFSRWSDIGDEKPIESCSTPGFKNGFALLSLVTAGESQSA